MRVIIGIALILSITLFSCSKEAGEGGRATISGKVFMTDTLGGNQGEYYIPDYDVYIIYGDADDVYDDDTKTNFDGTYEFKNLRTGTYRVFAYTADPSQPSKVSAVFQTVEVGSKKGTTTVEDIKVYK